MKRGGNAVADSSTGARNRKANGFCSPPVRNNSTASSAMSKASSQAARSGSSRCVHVEAQAQRDVEPGRQRDHRQAGPDRQVEIEPEIDHQHRGGLADDGEPAQPHQRVEAHVAARVVLAEAEARTWRQSSRARAGHEMLACKPRNGRRACTSCRRERHIWRPWMHAQAPPPSPSSAWSSSTRASTAVDGISFRAGARLDHRPARRQRRRQDHHHRHDHGAGDADLRHGQRARRRHAATSATACCTG